MINGVNKKSNNTKNNKKKSPEDITLTMEMEDDDSEHYDMQPEWGWPVQLKNRTNIGTDDNGSENGGETEKEHLIPGSCLQACTGSDIHLAKGATNTSSSSIVTKGKHKYLLLFPGVLSLNLSSIRRLNNNHNINSKEKENKETGDDNDDENDSQNENSSSPDVSSKATPAEETGSSSRRSGEQKADQLQQIQQLIQSGNLIRLGKLEKLGTDNPILKIVLNTSNEQQQNQELRFLGEKINTSSRFMMLTTCNRRRSNAAMKVVCKSIFTSVICFKEAQVITASNSDTGNVDKDQQIASGKESISISNAIATPSEDAMDIDCSADYNVKNPDSSQQLCHYGGSERTVDGNSGGSGTIKRKQTTATAAAAPRRSSSAGTTRKKKTEVVLDDEDDDDDDDDVSDDDDAIANDNDDNDIDDTDDEEFRVPKSLIESSQDTTTRKLPRRSTSTKKTQYIDVEASDIDIDEDDSSNNSSDDNNDDGDASSEDLEGSLTAPFSKSKVPQKQQQRKTGQRKGQTNREKRGNGRNSKDYTNNTKGKSSAKKRRKSASSSSSITSQNKNMNSRKKMSLSPASPAVTNSPFNSSFTTLSAKKRRKSFLGIVLKKAKSPDVFDLTDDNEFTFLS